MKKEIKLVDANKIRAFDWRSLTVTIGGVDVTWNERVDRIKEHMAAILEEKKVLYRSICNGRTWARILMGDREAIGRIGMVTEIITDRDKVLVAVRILSRKTAPGDMGEYLWGASWTRQYYPIEHLELFMLPGSGYTVWVPKMAWNGQIDGGCHVDPSKWIWHNDYSGPQIGEGAGKDEEYEITPGL